MYRIFDIALESDLALPELPVVEHAGTVIRVEAGNREEKPFQPAWFHEWKDDRGHGILQCGHVPGGYLLRFPDLADFYISDPYDVIQYFPSQELPGETLRHLLLDQVIPRVLGQQGRFILHASAVQVPGGNAIAFVGDTGWGKSTLACSYYTNHARLISDDCLLFETNNAGVTCIPNYAGLRLFEDSSEAILGANENSRLVSHYSSKKRLILHANENNNAATATLGAVFILNDPENNHTDKITARRIQGANELVSIISQLFILDTTNREVMKKQFNNAREIMEHLPAVFRLAYPRDFAKLGDVHDAIANALDTISVSA